MDLSLPVILLIIGGLCGVLGVLIAQNKDVEPVAGFFLGAFLGPIGLVVVALLNPTKQSPGSGEGRKLQGQTSLEDEGYKLWLISRYDIRKHDVLDSYVCDNRIFSSTDDAIQYAQMLDQQRIAEDKQRRAKEDKSFDFQVKLAKWLGVILLVSIFAAIFYTNFLM